jgi:hypothetical protein
MSITIKETAGGKIGARLREANQRRWDRQQVYAMEALRKETDSLLGIDIEEAEVKKLLDVEAPDFSIKHFVAACEKYARKSRESTGGASIVQQLLRAGIQTMINKEYQSVETSYQELVSATPSSRKIELYAPLYRAGFMSQVESGDEPGRISVAGADFQIRNRKFSVILEIDRDDIEDDQTGQLLEQAQQIAENAPILKDSRVFVRYLGKAGTDAAGEAVSASQTGSQAGETTWPYNSAFTKGGGSNRLATYAAASYQAILQLRQLARKMKDPKGNRMLVRPDTIWCGSSLEDGFATMLQAGSYPASASIHAAVTGGADMGVGNASPAVPNVLKGKYNLVSSIWLPDTAYGISQAGKGFRLQQRRPLEAVQENPLAGSAFLVQVYRWNVNERYECDWTEPRFSVAGSDGTI